jgi:hypothetical protein
MTFVPEDKGNIGRKLFLTFMTSEVIKHTALKAIRTKPVVKLF